jgi:hypothetical protein
MKKERPKKEVIIVRVTRRMKLEVEMLAEASRRSLSNYLRLVFEDIIEKNKESKK